jgi:hypothetical protein
LPFSHIGQAKRLPPQTKSQDRHAKTNSNFN